MNKNDVQNKGLTVSQAKQVSKVLEHGGTVEEAAHAAGITLTQLRQQGKLAATIKALLERADLDDKTRRQVGKARLTELALQDGDLKVALGAAKVISGEGVPGVAIQLNQNLVTDPDVLSSLKSLKIELEGQEDEQGTD
jgi:hypothetical protein